MENKTANKKIKISYIIIAIIIIFGLGYFTEKVIEDIQIYYQEQCANAVIQGVDAVILIINQKGEIPILVNETNETFVNWIPIQQICEGGK